MCVVYHSYNRTGTLLIRIMIKIYSKLKLTFYFSSVKVEKVPKKKNMRQACDEKNPIKLNYVSFHILNFIRWQIDQYSSREWKAKLIAAQSTPNTRRSRGVSTSTCLLKYRTRQAIHKSSFSEIFISLKRYNKRALHTRAAACVYSMHKLVVG